jgi:hypothetical protein
MKTAEVRLPDGRIAQFQVDDSTTEQDVMAHAEKMFSGAAPASNPDPTAGMSGGQRFLAGVGKGFNDAGMGLKGIAAHLGAGDAAGVEAQVAENRRLEAPLMSTGAGIAGSIAGAAAPFVALPGAATFSGAAAYGGLQGLLQPRAAEDSAVSDTAAGAVGGIAMRGLAGALGRAVQPVRSRLDPVLQRLAQRAAGEGITLNPAQLTGSPILKNINAALDVIPSTSEAQQAMRQAQQDQFNRAAMGKAGWLSDKADPASMSSAKDALSSEFSRLSAASPVNVDNQLLSDLGDAEARYAKNLEPDQARIVGHYLDSILGQGNSMSGETYQKARSAMGRRANSASDPALRVALKEVQSALDEAAFRSLKDPADKAAWQQARQRYGNLKAIQRTMERASAGSAAGDISPAALWQGARMADKNTFAYGGRGGDDLSSLARIGQAFVKEQIPNSGTPQRMMYQNLLTGGSIGGGIATLLHGNPGLALIAALGPTIASQTIPRMVQKGINSETGKKWLFNRSLDSVAGRTLAEALKRGLPPAGAGTLSSYLKGQRQ